MKQSIGYTVTLNIIIVFITIVIAFLCFGIIYYKGNKASNLIINSIEKYEGFNSQSRAEISRNLISIGYGSHSIESVCNNHPTVQDKVSKNETCTLVSNSDGRGKNGYCVYFCDDGNYTFYKIRTNIIFNIPIISQILDIPIYSNTNRMYKFSESKECMGDGKCFVDGKCVASC